MAFKEALGLLGIELGEDPDYNRRYIAELAIAYSFGALALYVLLTFASTAMIGSANALVRGTAAAAYILNYYMCHQMPERSLFLFGAPMGLCSRCAAIFVGALFAYPAAFRRDRLPRFMQSWAFVALALLPIAVDGTTQLLGMRESSNLERVATGLLSGFAVVYYLVTAILEKYSTGKPLARKGVLLPSAIPLAFLVFALLAAAVFVGGNYKGADYALAYAKAASPGAAHYAALYIPPHATASVQGDAYIGSFQDPVLHDLYGFRNLSSRSLGVWAGLALSTEPEYVGAYAYLSSASGDYYYIDAWDGTLLARARH
ncbi:MAG: DUF2085 domain-containing protein [Candidatus ainarchaeum sp.]|nr:DUF2085 domain-containing protein [Candidatus ainarchaeum sp.]